MTTDHKSLIDNKDDINATSDTSFVHPIAKVSFAENIDNISDCSLNEINAGDTTKGNLKHQRLNENTDENIASMPKRSSRARSTSIVVINTLRYKVSIVFVVFFTIGCCLIPIILYNISETGGNNVTDHGYSHEINISSAKVCYKHIHLHLSHVAIYPKQVTLYMYNNIIYCFDTSDQSVHLHISWLNVIKLDSFADLAWYNLDISLQPQHSLVYFFDVISSLHYDVCKFTILLLYGFGYVKNIFIPGMLINSNIL